MELDIRPRLTTGAALISAAALMMAPVVAGRPPAAPTPAHFPTTVVLTAATRSLPAPFVATRSAIAAPVAQLTASAPQNPVVEQVAFHAAFITDFVSTGAGLFAREFAIPGVLARDIRGGTPVPAAVGHALATFAQIELEAGGQLVHFALEYVAFQANLFLHLAMPPVAAATPLAPSAKPAAATVPTAKPPKKGSSNAGTHSVATESATNDDAPPKHGKSGVTHKSTSNTGPNNKHDHRPHLKNGGSKGN